MTAKNRTTLKSDLENGDTFDQTIAADLVDSAVNVADTTAQEMTSNLKLPSLHASTEVSGPSCKTSAAVHAITSASAMYTNTLFVGGGQILAGGGGAGGSLSVATTAETSIGSAGTFEPVNAGSFAAGPAMVDFSATSTGTLKYKGPVDKVFKGDAYISIVAAAVNKLTAGRLTVGGAELAGSEVERFISSTNIGTFSLGCLATVATSSEVGVVVANKTDTTNLTVEKMSLVVTQS